MKRILLVLFGLSLIGAGLAGGYFFARKPVPAVETATPTPAPTTAPTPSTSSPSAEIASTQTIQDSSGLYSVELPDSWQVKLEAAKGVRVSDLFAQSPDYKVKIDTGAEGPFTPIYYQTGASLQITVLKQPLADNPQPAGTITEQKSAAIDSIDGTFYSFREPSTAQGQLLEYRLEKDGYSYALRFGYNPATLIDGRALFEQIAASFRFLP